MRSDRSRRTKTGKPRLLRNARLAVETLETRLVLDSGPLVISEFMADNAHTLQDKDGAYSDWIEVYNPTQGAVNLEGWSLTDDADTLTKWQFPNTDLPGGGYLVVFASGKNVTTGLELHTSFNLDKAGEYLALVKPDGQTVSSSFAPEYPQQATDVSYGWSQDLATKGFFATPTPGKPNLEIPLPNSSQQIVVNEIMYHPGYGEAGGIDYVPENTAEEYIELYNRTSSPVSLKGWQLDKWWFALDPMKTITGISFSGTTATATLPGHGYVNGDSVQIIGAAPSQYNGVFTISNVTASTFDYTMSSAPTQAANGTITAQKGVRAVTSVTREDWTATVTLPAHGFVTGDSVLISGADQDPYNGVFTVTVLTPDTFAYTLPELPVTPATGTILAQKASQEFPDVTIPGQGYLVVAGDGKTFRQKYPAVANVIAAWTPKLSDSGERITLRNADGDKIDEVNYANEGDWAQRTRGEQKVTNISRNGTAVTVTVPYHGYTLNYRAEDKVYRIAGADQTEFNGEWTATAMTRDTITFTIAGSSTSATGNILIQKRDAGHYGWQWYTGADGHGKSLELISAKMTNNNGQNWGASTVEGGTPGVANSIAATDIAPLVSDVTHFPVIPSHTSTVTVTARISDELATGVTASVYYRVDGATNFTAVAMADDGLHGDSAAGDGVYGATLPAQANNTVVEFYVSASDAGSHVRAWPAAPGLGGVAPAALYSGQTANLLYQVDDTYTSTWTPGSQPVYRLIMKAADWTELKYMGSHDPDRWSDVALNGTFITVDGSGVELEYEAGFRNRGHGTRLAYSGTNANNYKVEIPHDRSWKGYENTIINYANSPSQVLGAVMSQAAGIAMPNEQPIQVRVNGVNNAVGTLGGGTDTRMYGAYAGKEQYDSQFTARAFSDDPDGNLYVVHYTDYPLQINVDEGDLRYEGASPDAYRDTYRKQTNAVQDDWSDLIHLTYVLNDTNISDADFLQEVSKVIDVNQWLRYIAFDTLMGNREGGLCTGVGDDYGLYRGIKDPRFKMVFWDTDTLTTAWGGSATAGIFSGYTSIPGLNRLLTNQDTVGMYYAQLKDLINTVFAAQNFNPMVDQIFAGWLPQAKINEVKTFMATRITNVLTQIPATAFTITSPLTVVNGYPHTTTASTALSGRADQVQTRSVTVNGQPATWNSSTGAWTAGTSTGGTGGSDFLVNTGDDWKYFAARGFNVTAYQATIPVTSVTDAESVISNPANRSGSWTQTTPTVNYINTGSGTALTFQEGVGSYADTQDTYIGQDSATTDHSSATLAVDTQVGSGGPAQSLLRFDSLFGNGAGQIPAGAVISSAILTINVSDVSVNGLKLYRMAQTWTEAATWQGIFGGDGIQTDGVEALATYDAALAAPTATGKYTIDVTTSLRAWLADPTKNFGWALLADGSDGIQISCSENATAGNRPLLTVTLNSQPTAGGHFGSDNAFPGQTGAVDNFVIEANYRVFIPTPGQWTFGVTSDDGFNLSLDNGVDPAYTATFDGTRSVADTLQTFNIAHAGTYNLRLVYFDNTGNAGVELYAASGAKTTFNTTDFHLLGDVAHGGLGDSDQGAAWYAMTYDELGWGHGPSQLGYGDNDEAPGGAVTYVDADPTTTTVEKNFTTYFRRTFQVVDPSQYAGLTLHLLYDDGAIVYLNGSELFRTSNMPSGTVTSMMGSNADTPSETTFYDFPIDLSKLQAGTNVLAVEIHQAGTGSGSGSTSSDISMDVRLEATRPGGTGSGLPLSPGINRFTVQTFDGPNGTGNRLQEGMIDVWCDVAGQTIAAGHITQNTTLNTAGSPYHVTGDVIVDAGVTLTVEPGATIFFDAGTGLTVNGRLLAVGTASLPIRFTRYPGSGAWDGLLFQNTMEDNRITYCIVEYGEGQFPGATDRYLIAADASKLLLDHDVLDHAQYRRIRTTNSSLIVRNTTFTDIFGPSEAPITNNGSEQIWGNNASAGGQVLIENNVFGTTKGHNDVMDVDGGIKANGDPVIVVRNNVFMGGGDEAMDLEGDFLIEGNLIMHFKKDSYAEQQDPAGQCNSISAGDAHLVGHHYEVVNNVFYDVDHVVLAKDKTTLTFTNNTVINVTATKPAIYFEIVGDSAGAGTSADVDASIFQNVPIMFDFTVHSGAPTPQLTVNRSIVPTAWFSYGTGNIDADPRIANPAGGDFSLLPGSPALGTGLSGHDMGGMVPAGAWVTGEPPAITSQTGATLAVSGMAITHYKYRLNSGVWSAETPVSTPIQLSSLTDGTYTVYVVGKNLANLWQDVSAATASATWTVNTSRTHLRINEVLASNTSVNYQGAVTDLVELYNDGAPTVDLGGMSISDDAGRPDRFVFPAGTTLAPGQCLVLFADNAATTGLHLGFALDADAGGVYLFDTADSGGALLDSVEYGPQVTNYSIGRVGHEGTWTLTQPTFGAANAAARTGNPATLKLNEWLANGQVRLADDFVELYNPDSLPVPLAGLYLTDNTVNHPARHQIAALSYAPAGGCAALIADGNADQGANHLGFKLNSWNEWIGLYDAELKLMDRILHFDQTTDVSQGRSPDGGASPYQFFTIPTPSLTNAAVPANITNLANSLRITKLMYNPAGDGDYEFIELKNTSADKTLDLTGVRLGGGVSFTFPVTTPATTLTPGQAVLLVRNQAKFTARYGTGVNVAGEYVGKLADGGDSIILQLPAPFDSAILRFDYKDGWYEGTDGGGYALTVKDTAAAAALWNDPANWLPGTALDTLIWNKTGDGNWTEARWTGSSPSSPDSTSNAVVSTPQTVTVDSAQAANSLAVNDSGQVTIAATGSLAVGKDVQIAGGGRVEILAGGSLTAGGTVVVCGGAMTLPAGPSGATVGGLSVQGGANISGGALTAGVLDLRSGTVTTNLLGSAAATKTTTSTVTLSGANTYAGGTTVSEGTLVISSAAALPAGGSLTIGSGGTVVLSSGLSAFGTADSGAVAIAAALAEPEHSQERILGTCPDTIAATLTEMWPTVDLPAMLLAETAVDASLAVDPASGHDAVPQAANQKSFADQLAWLWESEQSGFARPFKKKCDSSPAVVDRIMATAWC